MPLVTPSGRTAKKLHVSSEWITTYMVDILLTPPEIGGKASRKRSFRRALEAEAWSGAYW
jgi:hypothetical protein